MGSTETVDWKETARTMRQAGRSERSIAEELGKSPSTIHGAVKDVVPGENGHGEIDAEALARAAGLEADRAEATAGQQTIDGGEVQAQPFVEELRVDGTTQLSAVPSLGGKKPQSATVTLAGGAISLLDGKAFENGDTIQFAGTATVFDVGQRHKADPKTRVVVTAVQRHTARIDDLVVFEDAANMVRRFFDAVVADDRQASAALADELVRRANGGDA